MPKQLSVDDWPSLLKPGQRVYVPGAAGESTLLMDALERAPAKTAGINFFGVWFPGANRRDLASLHPNAHAETFFVSPELRNSFEAGRTIFRPLVYTEVQLAFESDPPADIALFHVSPPNKNGNCSFGLSADFGPTIAKRAKCLIAHINPNMPSVACAPSISFEKFDYVIDLSGPLITYDTGSPDAILTKIGENVASMVEDGDTIEFGIGKGPAASVLALQNHRNLKIHSGMLIDAIVDLADAGALADGPASIVGGVALGHDKLYEFIASDPRVQMKPVIETHAINALASINCFTAINSVIEIDLFGQANSEMVKGKLVSGPGGLTDFLRGARASEGGKAILALPSTAAGDTISRIVPVLPSETPVSVHRGDVEYVVTEHGIANLRGRSLDQRAEELIAIAAPNFRKSLSEHWAQLRKSF